MIPFFGLRFGSEKGDTPRTSPDGRYSSGGVGMDGSGFGRASTRFEAKASADLIEATFKPFVAQRAGGIMYIALLCMSIAPEGLRSV